MSEHKNKTPASILRRAVGKTVAAVRKDEGLTQQALAGRLGWVRRKVGKVERAEIKLSIDEFVAIAHALKWFPPQLLTHALHWGLPISEKTTPTRGRKRTQARN